MEWIESHIAPFDNETNKTHKWKSFARLYKFFQV